MRQKIHCAVAPLNAYIRMKIGSLSNEDLASSVPLIGTLLLVVVAIISYSRGFWLGIQGWGVFNWYIDYGSGFIKRGLIGTIMSSALQDRSASFVETYVARQHLIFSIVLGIGLAVMAYSTLKRDWKSAFLIWLCFVTSQFLPTLAYNSGYLDIYLFVLIAFATVSLKNSWFPSLTVVGFVGPFIHEMFLFLWLHVLILSVLTNRGGSKVHKAIALAAPFVAVGLILAFHSQEAVALQLLKVPVDDSMRSILFRQQFGQTTAIAVSTMIEIFSENIANWGSATIYFLIPTILMCALAHLRWRRFENYKTTRLFLLVLSALAPASVLLVAWDLSRFLVTTTLCCALAFWALDNAEEVL